MKTIRLITCENLVEAHLIKNKLNNEGIYCFLTNKNFTNLMPLYNHMLGAGIQVIINERDYEKARMLIKDKLEPGEAARHICSYCGSDQIVLGIGKNKGIKFFTILIAIWVLIPVGNLKPNYYCNVCKKEMA